MSFSPIGDTVALVHLAHSLYSRVFVVARDAPEQFEELSHELHTIKTVLYQLGRDVVGGWDSTYNALIREIVVDCYGTLRGLGDLIAKYENLGE